MDKFELYDIVLKNLSGYGDKNNFANLCNEYFGNKGLLGYGNLKQEMVKLDLIYHDNKHIFENHYEITPKGKDVIDNYGGYRKYIDLQKGRSNKEINDIEKSRYELKITKRKYFLFWVITFFAVIGGIKGIVDLVKVSETKSLHEQIIFQSKRLDSLSFQLQEQRRDIDNQI